MAKIYLKLVKTEPIFVSNDRARGLAQDKKKFEEKELENTWMDIENFHGYLSDIRSIVFDDETKRNSDAVTNYKPLTIDEVAKQKAMMARVRKNVFGK